MSENVIRKKTSAVADSEKKLGKIKEELRAQCTHTKNGEPSLVPSNDPRVQGELKYVCKQCMKPVIISSISEDELENACNIVDRAVDIIKITAGNINSENDAEIINKLAKLQFRIRNDLMPIYRASLKKGNRNNKPNRERNESSWGRPTTYGR